MLSYMLPTEDKPPPGKIQNHNDLRNYTSNVMLKKTVDLNNRTMNSTLLARLEDGTGDRYHQQHHQTIQIQGQTVIPIESPKHNGTGRKSTLHTSSRVTKDDSLYSIDSDASTVGSERKNKILNGAKHASLKR